MQAPDQLSLRSISAPLRAALEAESRRRGQSLDKTVLALLAERLGLADETEPAEHDGARTELVTLDRDSRHVNQILLALFEP